MSLSIPPKLTTKQLKDWADNCPHHVMVQILSDMNDIMRPTMTGQRLVDWILTYQPMPTPMQDFCFKHLTDLRTSDRTFWRFSFRDPKLAMLFKLTWGNRDL